MKYRYEVTIILLIIFIGIATAFSGCINSSTPYNHRNINTGPIPIPTTAPIPIPTTAPIPIPKPIPYGYIKTMALDETKIELIDLNDNYDKYEVETNVGTVNYRGYTYMTSRITLWGKVTVIYNNVIEYELTTVVISRMPELKVFGYFTTITFDEKTELIKFSDNYDRYEVEDNVGTVNYRGYTYMTGRVSLWRGDTKRIINNVVNYNLGRRYI